MTDQSASEGQDDCPDFNVQSTCHVLANSSDTDSMINKGTVVDVAGQIFWPAGFRPRPLRCRANGKYSVPARAIRDAAHEPRSAIGGSGWDDGQCTPVTLTLPLRRLRSQEDTLSL